ncbi:MAG: hypothetical protein AAF558_15885, partial [Verrucomicrobiota bacterium]
FCEWLEPAEWFDCRGANATAEWLGVGRKVVNQLNSPIDVSLLRQFAKQSQLQPDNPLWQMMRLVGQDLREYITSMRSRLDFIDANCQIWDIPHESSSIKALFMPRQEPMSEEPGFGIGLYIENQGLENSMMALVYPDRRGSGYGLSRYNDHPQLDFTQIDDEPDVHFTHARGFLAKVTATDIDRLKALIKRAYVSS